MRSRWWWALLLLLPIGFFALYEPYEYITPGSPPADVMRNPHAAAERLLQQRGHDTQRILSATSLFPLPARDHLLVLDSQRSAIDDQRAHDLLQWVADGGHLVVAARPLPKGRDAATANAGNWHDNDPLLWSLGVTVWPTDAPDPEDRPDLLDKVWSANLLFERFCTGGDKDMRQQCINAMCGDPQRQWVQSELPMPGRRPPRELGLNPRLDLRQPDLQPKAPAPKNLPPITLLRTAGNKWGYQMLQLGLGHGTVTVLTGLRLWDNDHLHLLDNAWFLADLTDDSGPVWFVHDVSVPPLAVWLWQQAWPVILALLLWLALFLWRHIPRFGPQLAPTSRASRDFLDHLHAAARFLWRSGNRSAALDGLRRQVRSRLREHYPRADEHRRITLAAEQSGFDEERIRRALDAAPDTPEDMTQTVAILQTLRSRP